MSSVEHHQVEEDTAIAFSWGKLAWTLVAVVTAALAARYIDKALPACIVAGVITALMPRRHGSIHRALLGAIAFFSVLFVARMWPDAASAKQAAVSVAPGSLLSWLIGLPIVAALFVLFLPRQSPKVVQGVTLSVMLVELVISLPLLRVAWDRGFHLVENKVWIEEFQIRYLVGIDGISLWLIMLTVFIVPIAAYASFGSVTTRIKDWCFSLLMLQGAMIGAFLALDLFLFYVFWELMLIPMYVMIGVWGGSNRVYAAVKFFLYTMAGSVLMLAAILYLAYSYSKLTGTWTFDYFELQRVLLPRDVQLWLWGAFTLSFLIKVPMFPLHTWLPDAHTEAPTAGSVILAAVMLKLGTYGYLRFCLGLFPEASAELAANLAGVAVLGGILYGALCAWKQDDFKRLVAYSSVAHLGYVMLGIFAATQASIEGAVLQMVNHGISTGALFLLVGVIYDRRHTRMIEQFGGLAKVMPVYTALFIVATLASVGLPGTNGFVGEFLIITGTFVTNKLGHMAGVQAIGAALGVILGALYMLSVVQRVFFGPIKHKENLNLPDINGRELVAMAPLVAMIFIIGLFPQVFIAPMKGAVERTREDFVARIDQHPGPDYYRGEPRLLSRRPDAPPSKPANIAAK